MSKPEPRKLQAEQPALIGGETLVGKSAVVNRVRALILQFAATDFPVLLTGETGTGKEVVSRLIHSNSPRAPCPFVALNCAALPEHILESELFGYERGAFTGAEASRPGLMESAASGTLFLDEIGEMKPHIQAKLLRALEDGSVYRLGSRQMRQFDVRVIAATNADVDALKESGAFRADLYHRLSVVRIDLPPLRERPEDIPLLVHYFLRQFSGPELPPPRVSAGVLIALVSHSWPGNVRELRNTVRAAIVSDPGLEELGLDHLPSWFTRQLDSQPSSGETEEGYGSSPLSIRPIGTRPLQRSCSICREGPSTAGCVNTTSVDGIQPHSGNRRSCVTRHRLSHSRRHSLSPV